MKTTIETDSLEITAEARHISVVERWRESEGLPCSRIILSRKAFSELVEAEKAMPDRSVGEIEAQIGAE